MTGAVIGSAIIGAASSAQASNKAASAAGYAADQQAYAAEMQNQVAREQLEFQKEQQARWEEVFGPTEDHLAEYYNTLDPNDEAAKRVQGLQQAYQKYQQQIDTTLAQRGLNQSGLQAELTNNAMYQNERDKALVRADAPRMVAEQQAGFLGLGMGQSGVLQQGMNNAYGNQINAYSNQMNMYGNNRNLALQQQAQADQNFGKAIGAGMMGLGYGFSGGFGGGTSGGSLNVAPAFGGSW